MNIAELKGEKTVSTLAKRLLAEPSRGSATTSRKEMEAALLRLNPHLNQIGALEKGTPILVPDQFALDPAQSVKPLGGMAEELLGQAKRALTNLRAMLKDHVAQSAEQSNRVQTWLKSDQAKEFARGSSDLKNVFSTAAADAKTLAKEQAGAIAAQDKALAKVASQLAHFRRT